MTDNSLQLGIAAFKAGNKEQARSFLLKAVREEPNNESAWGWLSNTTSNAEERIHCLHQVVRINPHNESAAKLLKELETNEWVNASPVVLQNRPQNSPAPVNLAEASSRVNKKPWYRETLVVIACLLFFFPGFVLIVLTDEKESNTAKIVVVMIQIILCCIAYFVLAAQLGNLSR